MPASVRTVLPLATVTCTSMLAMDFYLPAVPSLRLAFGIDVELAQATIAIFLAGLATSQLAWAEIMARVGPRRAVQLGVWLLVVSSAAAAVAPNIEVLIAARLVQGIAAGAATVIAPSVVRGTLSDADAVRGIAAIAMIEAIVPAAGPLFGALVLEVTDWRGIFWVLAFVTLAVLPFAVRATPVELPDLDNRVPSSYRSILASSRFRRIALSHALSMGALLTFIASAPQLIASSLTLGAGAFVVLQAIGVAAFVILASQAGRFSARVGAPRAVQLGAAVQLVLSAALLAASMTIEVPFAGLCVFWFVFCGALAIRGPAAMSEALDVPASQLGRASAMLVLALLLAGASGTQLVAPFLDGHDVVALATALTTACAISLALVLPYPAAPIGSSSSGTRTEPAPQNDGSL